MRLEGSGPGWGETGDTGGAGFPQGRGESLEGREQGSWWGVDGAGRVGGDPGAYHGYQREKGSSGDRGEKEENGPGTCSGARASRSR